MKLSIKKINNEQRELDDLWSTGIKARANWCCAICGDSRYIAAHHIIPREHREYRYADDNGLPLCRKHHKFSRIISAHNNPLAFFIWMESFRPELFKFACERQKEILKREGIIL